jgi:hypothetical protein
MVRCGCAGWVAGSGCDQDSSTGQEWTLVLSAASLALSLVSIVTWFRSVVLYRRSDVDEGHLLLLINVILIALCAMYQLIQI